MEKLNFKVADYDAPLDLILHLLSKHKLDILDIDISSLLEQYMETIRAWQRQDMDVASEFLEMASRLVYIKTVSLLPRHEEEHERLRQELTGQLVEYSLCKVAAVRLGEQSLLGDTFVRPPVELEIDPTYTLTHTPDLLYTALIDAMGKGARRLPPPREAFAPIVSRPVVSVTSKIFTVLRTLRANGRVRVDRLYLESGERSGMIATFLALLELIKTKKIVLRGQEIALRGEERESA